MIERVQEMPATFTVAGLPVKVERPLLFLLLLVGLPLLVLLARWRQPERSWGEALLAGWLYLLVLLTPDATHISGHALSARWAGAPMDAVYVPVGMPRTLYDDDDVPPEVHIQRSLGGPIASLLALLVSLLLYRLTRSRTLSRELVGLAVMGHGLIGLGSLLPIPGVDGAIILHWYRRR